MAEETQKVKPVPIDLNAMTLVMDDIEVVEGADAFAAPPPVDDGKHLVKLEIFRDSGTTGFTQGTAKDGRKYIQARLVATVIDPAGEFDGQKVFDSASTLVLQSSGTCRMAGILERGLGVRVPGRINPLELARLLAQNLEGGATVGIQTQWVAQAKQADGTYKTLVRGQKKFPVREDGKYEHILRPEDGDEVSAQANIVRYFPAEEVQ